MNRKLMVLWAVVLCLPLQAGKLADFGVKGGFELTEMNFNSNDLQESNRAGFYVGPVVKFKLPVVGLGIDASLLYSKRDLKVDGNYIDQQSLLLPANLRYGVGLGSVMSIFASAGPQLSFNIGDDIFHWKDDELDNHQYSLQNTMISFNFGLGLNFGGHLEAGIYYNVPMGKTADFTWEEVGTDLVRTDWSREKTRTNAWHVAVAYYF